MKGEAKAMFRAIDERREAERVAKMSAHERLRYERQQKKRARNVTIKRVIITLLLLAWLVLLFML